MSFSESIELNGHSMDDDEAAHSPEIAQGIGKLEQLRFGANPKIAAAIRTIIAELGEDPDREGLLKTPQRVAIALAELTAGYHIDPAALVNDAVFTDHYDEMVLVRNIEFSSMCEHHMLPFYGRAHVAYIPNGKIIGLSKISRIVDMFARRLQVQERMTVQIADFLMTSVDALGVGVVCEGVHLCGVMRGVRKENASMVTSAMRGNFKSDVRTRSEFMNLVQGRNNG